MTGRAAMPMDAGGRFRAARALLMAGIVCRNDDPEVAAANAVLAGVAAADVVTCLRRGRVSERSDRSDALTLLRELGPEGGEAAVMLDQLLALKRRPHGTGMTAGEARRAFHRARWLVAEAEQVLLGPEVDLTAADPQDARAPSVPSAPGVPQDAHDQGLQVLR